jgi:hypothetical protein
MSLRTAHRPLNLDGDWPVGTWPSSEEWTPSPDVWSSLPVASTPPPEPRSPDAEPLTPDPDVHELNVSHVHPALQAGSRQARTQSVYSMSGSVLDALAFGAPTPQVPPLPVTTPSSPPPPAMSPSPPAMISLYPSLPGTLTLPPGIPRPRPRQPPAALQAGVRHSQPHSIHSMDLLLYGGTSREGNQHSDISGESVSLEHDLRQD